MHQPTADLRIRAQKPLIAPAVLEDELPLADAPAELIARSRREIAAIVTGRDDRLLVVVGPCSIHDPASALDYARLLLPIAQQHAAELVIAMRVYFEKPRTVVGWKGLINDPFLNDSFQINAGLQVQHLAGMIRAGVEGFAGQQDQILRLVPGVTDIGQQGGSHQRAGEFKEGFHRAGSMGIAWEMDCGRPAAFHRYCCNFVTRRTIVMRFIAQARPRRAAPSASIAGAATGTNPGSAIAASRRPRRWLRLRPVTAW